MNDKQLLKEFKKISSLKPNQEWKAQNRELLLNQISSTVETSKLNYFNFVLKSFSLMPQSAMVAVFIFVIILSGGILGLQAAKNAIPGDSLYIAKIVREKTKFALTFNDKNKARLGLEFAGNRAKEINQVLANADVSENKDEKVEKLMIDFHKEMSATKTRLEKINQNNKEIPVVSPDDNLEQEQDNVVETELAKNDEEDSHVFSANLGKDENGLQIYDINESKNINTDTATNSEDITFVNDDQNASTTESESTEGESTETSTASPEEILKQAGDSLEDDDIGATLILMEEAGQVVDQQVDEQGVDESGSATSTEVDLATTSDVLSTDVH